MRHPNDGILRRLCDEPLAIPVSDRAHIERCKRCQTRLSEIRGAGFRAAAILNGGQLNSAPATLVPVDTNRALRAVRERLVAENAVPVRHAGWVERIGMRAGHLKTGLVGAGVAVALTGALVFTPAGSLAQSFVSAFQPTHVVALQINAGDLRTLPDLRGYGTTNVPRNSQPRTVGTIADASSASGMTVLQPAYLPAGTPSNASYQVMPSQTGSFTFNAAKARETASRIGKPVPSMPPGMDGSTLSVTTGAVAMSVYGQSHDVPALVVGQMRAPKVSSTGVPVEQMEDYLLSLPGVSPSLAASLKALGDPTKTGVLPIPIPVNMASAQDVQVQGVKGLEIGDSTGIGSVVVWEKDGIIYGAGGTITQGQALRVADSLK